MNVDRVEFVRIIDDAVKRIILPEIERIAAEAVESRVMPAVEDAARSAAAQHARAEALAVVRGLVGREFTIAVTPVEGA